MTAKPVPFTDEQVRVATDLYDTPFYLYSAQSLTERVRDLQEAFSWNPGFKEYFAVKALPNPEVLKLLRDLGCGADCASGTELTLASMAGIGGQDIMFTSNNTAAPDLVRARQMGAIINLDSLEMVDFLAETAGIPDTVCVRYTPEREVGTSNEIMGEAGQSKFGMTRPQVLEALVQLRDRGATRFGIHCMAASNSLNQGYYPALARELFTLSVQVKEELGISISFLNFAGGLGIPYLPDESPLDLQQIGQEVRAEFETVLTPAGLTPAIYTELGRYLSGPAGVLVTRVRHLKSSYKNYVGVDASATDLLRPAMYGAYHHISTLSDRDGETGLVDVVGSLCENNDKFAIDRELPRVEVGDILLIHDAGAHGYSMGYNYNGVLRGGEVLLETDGTARLIRRPQTEDDYLATLQI